MELYEELLSKECPECGTLCDEHDEICDCGHVFWDEVIASTPFCQAMELMERADYENDTTALLFYKIASYILRDLFY